MSQIDSQLFARQLTLDIGGHTTLQNVLFGVISLKARGQHRISPDDIAGEVNRLTGAPVSPAEVGRDVQWLCSEGYMARDQKQQREERDRVRAGQPEIAGPYRKYVVTDRYLSRVKAVQARLEERSTSHHTVHRTLAPTALA